MIKIVLFFKPKIRGVDAELRKANDSRLLVVDSGADAQVFAQA